MRPNEELLQKIGIVRKRWQAFLWARGLAWVLGVLVVSLVIGLAMADSTNIPTWTVTALRLGMVALFIFTLIKALILPLRRVPDDMQLARFVEEKNPGLDDRLVSAVEALTKPKPEQGIFAHLLVKDALERTRNVRFSDQVNKRKFGTFAALAAMFGIALIVSLYISSLFFPVGSVRLLAGLLKPPADDIFDLKVTPGNATVPRGTDVIVQLTTGGFDPRRAEIHLRYQNSSQWEISVMDVAPQNVPTFRQVLFNLQEPVTYFIDADGHRSPEFTIRVEDLPRVEKMDYTYNYPAYTGLAPNKQEGATDMVALRGTVVDVVVHGSQPLSGGAIIFSDGKSVPLTPSSERDVAGKVTVDRNATFRIKLVNSNKQEYTSLEEYSMEATEDGKPIVEFTKPGRDEKATNVQEVFTELRANDDFGVNKLELHYSVNGGAEQTVELFQNKGAAPKEISGSHTFFMEEFNLQPGDFVTYFGKAVDTRNPANVVQTDMYFIEIRPFSKEYYQGQQGGGGGGGGGGQQDDAAALSKRQRDIIVATDRLKQNKDKFKAKEFTDNLHALSANQTKLVEQTDTLLGRLSRRGLDQNKQIKDLTENLKQAMEQMTPAADKLQKEDPNGAMPFEQKALNYLLRAEALFTEIQVTRGGGGGGGGGGQSAQDLADLFELELDQSKNQYETVQRGEMQRNTQEVDEMLKKLQELAQRQQKLMERRAMQQQGGGSGGDQMDAQDLQREVEKMARQLEKLSRDNNDRQMSDVARQMQQAAQNMQRQAQGGNAQSQAQAAQQALEQLNRARQMLQNSQSGNAQEKLAQARDEAKRLRQEQNQVTNQTRQLGENTAGANAQQRQQQLASQQQDLADQARQLQQNLESSSANGQDRQSASAARNAANSMKSSNTVNRMAQAANMIAQGFPGLAPRTQEAVEQSLADLEKQLGESSTAANGDDQQKMQNALNKTSDTARALESMQRRLQEAQRGQRGQQQGQQPGQQQGQQPGGQQQGQSQGQQQGQGQGQGQGQQQGQQQAQGQGQGQGQGQQQGQNGGGRQGGRDGGPTGGNYGGNFNGGQYSGGYANGDVRQVQREYEQRLRDIQDLRNMLGPNDPTARQLDQIANAMRVLARSNYPGDPAEIDKLANQIIEPMKNLELELSRRLQIMIGKDNIRSAQEDEMPAAWRKYIEDYYKRLGSQKPPGQQ